jgi:polyisoprenoid-binding protein YceI
MATIAAQPFSGTYHARPEPSTFAFAVRHSGVFWYRGTLPDVTATAWHSRGPRASNPSR